MSVARKLREYKPHNQLRKIKGHGQKSNFNYPLLIFAILFIIGLVTFESKPEREKKESIKEFVEKSLPERTNKQKKYPLGNVSDKQVKEIFELTGIDVKGYKWVIENFFLFHALSKHGDNKQEQKRGQIGIKPIDFEMIPEIINKPDEIKLLKSKQTNVLLQFGKRIDKLYFYVVEIRKGKKEIVGKTMFKRE